MKVDVTRALWHVLYRLVNDDSFFVEYTPQERQTIRAAFLIFDSHLTEPK